ncbi:uncharacterized protein LOC126368874 [Pectinophora gossypiella]|uniref:uncharacterized protein LOC126368874 n=1 Tax=Pectinophora gossypiella TaxID=13191 RepID=UPI00214EBDCB|nr:uncharacterized protein LOC126368874 [Pectinophora gossypiella]
MTERARGAVRSSARLSGGAAAGGAAGGAAGEGAARAAARSAEAAAAAARRRARAAERAREVEDSPRELRDKCRRLARALRDAKHLVVYTGAGISTAADIPDYRGPHGVWTRLQRGESVGRVEVSRAQPTLTHMALTAMWARGLLKFVVSQNCDGLHLRAGLPRRALAELHGNMFAERCAACRRVYLRAFDTTERTARHAHGTRRLCHACGAELADTIVHFGERGRAAWPLNWAGALRHAAAADVVLCLGSSLKVLRRYPRLWRMQRAPHARPALYIVNLQWTPKDAVAALKINARCDAVMAQVARRLRLRVPRYEPRRDPLLAHAVPLAPSEEHTTRRPLLRVPSASDDDSDSDDELPLRRLAERIREPPPSPPPHPTDCVHELPLPLHPPPRLDERIREPPRVLERICEQPPPPPPRLAEGTPEPPPPPPPPAPAAPALPPPPDLLHAFQVNMRSGDATILLRAQHAPSAPGRRPASELRLFRMQRLAPRPNGRPPSALGNGRVRPPRGLALTNGHGESVAEFLSNLRPEPEPKVKREDGADIDPAPDREGRRGDLEPQGESKPEEKTEGEPEPPAKYEGESKWKREADEDLLAKPSFATKSERESPAGVGAEAEGEASALAAAIIARAVLLCRASLYPGLHTILAPPPRARAACAWCARHCAARRCLWYPPPPSPPPPRAARACACCAGPAPAPAGAGGGDDTGGWYGKGYRKGRRRRR